MEGLKEQEKQREQKKEHGCRVDGRDREQRSRTGKQ